MTDIDLPGGIKVADISDDICVMIMEETAKSHNGLMQEVRGNAQSSHSIVRHSGARKFNQEDPIEAAATEMILNKN